MKEKDTFYRQIWKLVLPILIQNLLSAAVNSSDVIMLNYVGQSAISAVSLASQYAGILFSVYYGLGTGATMLCAQYYGKRDMRAVEVVQGIALRFSLIISLGFSLCAALIPNTMMKLFTDDAELIALPDGKHEPQDYGMYIDKPIGNRYYNDELLNITVAIESVFSWISKYASPSI